MHQIDKDLQANVTEEMKFDPSFDAGHLTVTANDGAVKISGEIATLPQRHAAKRSAMRVRGVKAVSDDMTVRDPGTTSGTDLDMTEVVHRMLDWACDVPANSVKATVRDHVITLTGNVRWEYQRDAAMRAVMNLKGITAVTNQITLDQSDTSVPEHSAIAAAFRRNAQLEPTTINVDVNGTELVLKGNVRSFAEYRQAEHTAWAAAGVTKVRNDLLIAS